MKDVHGNAVDSHGAHVSGSLIAVTMDSCEIIIISMLKLFCSNKIYVKMSDGEEQTESRELVEDIVKDEPAEPQQEAIRN